MTEDKSFISVEAVDKAMQEPDWPRGTEVVVYARKEDREKALMKMAQKGYTVTKFIEMDGLQAEIMGDGRFMAAKAEFLREPIGWKTAPQAAVQKWKDRLKDSVIYIPPDLIEQMKCVYPTWRDMMLGGTRPSDWSCQDKPKE